MGLNVTTVGDVLVGVDSADWGRLDQARQLMEKAGML